MKTFFISIAIVLGANLIGFGIWFFISSKTPEQNNAPNPTLPAAPAVTATTVQNKTIPDQQASTGTQPVIANSFLGQIQNSNLITLKGTVIASDYALQMWDDENKGGQALLRYDSSRGWVLISLGGGEWSILSLTQIGVPQLVAEKLVAGSK